MPKAGVFAEGAARIVAQHSIAEIADGGERAGRHLGQGTCYIEFGEGRIGSVDIDFLSGPERTGHFNAPSPRADGPKEPLRRHPPRPLVRPLTDPGEFAERSG